MAKIARIRNRAAKTRGRKIKKWAKGHCSDSNPTLTHHRDMAAHSRFIINESTPVVGRETNKFTGKKIRFETNKLVSKSETLLEKLKLDDNDELSSLEGDSEAETAETQFSRFTNCSNPTFNKVHRLWKSGSELQNAVLSVLAAVTEVIKRSGGRETEVEYFAALLTSFCGGAKNDASSSPPADEGPDWETSAATAYLLSLVITKVPYAVLIGRFSHISQAFFERLCQSAKNNAENPHANALLRYVIDSFGVLLKAQPTHAWDSPVLHKMCDSLLTFAVDPRPRIRKSAQRAVGDMVNSARVRTNNGQYSRETIAHPVARLCAHFCTQTIDKCGAAADGQHVTRTLHVVRLLQRCMHNFGPSHFEACAETLLKLLTLRSATVYQSVVRCFACLLANKPSDRTLTAATNARLVVAFYDFEPSNDDQYAYSSWCKVQMEAHCCLVDKDVKLASDLAPKFFDKLSAQLTIVSDEGLLRQCVQMIKRFFNDCLRTLAEKDGFNTDSGRRIGDALNEWLNVKYLAVWPVCFELLSSFFESTSKVDAAAGDAVSLFNVKRLIGSMGELRESENPVAVVPLEKCLGSAVRFFGPELVLGAIHLSIDPSVNLASDFPNSWLLPILRNNVQKARLSHFVRTFLPAAVKLKQRLGELEARHVETYAGERRVLDALQRQIWELLPAYCKSPPDLANSFKEIAKILGCLLSDAPTLRLIVLNCLRTLVLRCMTDADKSEMARFAPNFLPILFGVFLNDDATGAERAPGYDFKGVRLACLETIRIYVTITPLDCLRRYLHVALDKIKLDDSAFGPDRKHRVMDILIAMARFLDESALADLFAVVKTYCSRSTDKSLQKKAYRALEEAFAGTDSAANHAKAFFDAEQIAIKTMLFTDLDKASPSTKASRIRCLCKLFENGFLSPALLPGVLPSVVRTLRENNVKTRRSAAVFFILACNLLVSRDNDVRKGAGEAFGCLWPWLEDGWREPPDTCSALVAARLFVFEFKNDCPSDMLSALLSRVIGRISSENRQIVQCCLEFLKTFVSCTSQIILGQYLDVFVPALYAQTDDCQRHFRFLTRKILAKLMLKVPYELVFKLVPAGSFQKQLNNVRKMLRRYERRKSSSAAGDEKQVDEDLISGITGLSRPETIANMLRDTSDEESDAESGVQYDKRSKSRHSKGSLNVPVFLRETGDDGADILDFLDTKSVSMITTMAIDGAKKSALKRKNHGFKVDDKGRLIIGIEDENRETQVENLDLHERKLENDRPALKRRKKIDFVREDEDSDIDEALHYKTGGKGIHRDTTENDQEDGSQFRAKKAKGDVKKGSVQPYAYHPFDFKQLNRRKRAKSAGKYKNLMQGARKGATKGSKGRRKLKRL